MTHKIQGLSELLGNNKAKVQLVVRMLCRSVAMDLQRLMQAAVSRQWQTVRELAQRIYMACLQLSERKAAEAAAALGRVSGMFFSEAYARCHKEIVGLTNRAERLIGECVSGASHLGERRSC